VTPEEKAAFKKLVPEAVTERELAGDPIEEKIDKPRGTINRSGHQGLDADRLVRGAPSGTEDLFKLYAESIVGEEHLERIIGEARDRCEGAADK